MAEEKVCFVISPIGEENSQQRIDADKVLKFIITPAVEKRGYIAMRADQISNPGLITPDILQRIVEVPLVIADLTGHNPNVFYELAVRHMLRKPVIQIIRKDDKLPFDIAQIRTIRYSNDVQEATECQKEIIRLIDTIEADPSKVDNPISMSVELKSLTESSNPLEQSYAEILGLLQSVFSKLTNVDENTVEIKNTFYELSDGIRKQVDREYKIQLLELIEKMSDLEHQVAEYQYELSNYSEDVLLNEIEEWGRSHHINLVNELEALELEREQLEMEILSNVFTQLDDEFWDQIETDKAILQKELEDDIPF